MAQAAAMEAPVSSLEQVINEEPTGAPAPDLPRATEPDFLREAQQIVNAATAQAAQMVQEAKDLLEVAVKKTEEKRALDDARAEAKKILDKAKAEVAKIRAAVAKLGGKKPRGKAKAEGEAKAARTVYDIEDFKGRKITKLVEPVVRGDSARGALTVTVANCKSTDEALEYQGATPAFIMKMVERGLISVE
jgi:cell division septum initiation protein DivIVA